MLKSIAVLALTLLFGGCATPDVKPFSDQTANLASAVAAEHKQIAGGWDVLLMGTSEEEKKRFKTQQTEFKEASDPIDLLLNQAVTYSDRLVELADAGEKGADAADSLLSTVKQFGSLAGMPGMVLSDGATKVFKDVAKFVTRIEAQKSLEDATSAAQPAVEMLADGIIELEKVLPELVDPLRREQLRVLEKQTGVNLIGLYEDVKNARESIYSNIRLNVERFDPVKGFCVDNKNSVDPACKASQDLQAIDALNKIVVPIEPSYNDYIKRQLAVKTWISARLAKSKEVSDAAATWATEHKKITDILKKCGGLRVLKCQNLNAGNLKVTIDKLKAEF